jgi:flagellar biogenesis protein FliO
VVTINQQKKDNSSWKMAALYGSLSLNLGLMIMGGFFLGRFIEEQFQMSNMKTTGILVGLFLGLYEMFSIAFRATKHK